jgi:hypothetical protein
MYKWHVHSAIGRGRPLAQDIARVTDGIATTLRAFSSSARNAEGNGTFEFLRYCSRAAFTNYALQIKLRRIPAQSAPLKLSRTSHPSHLNPPEESTHDLWLPNPHQVNSLASAAPPAPYKLALGGEAE